MLKKNKNLDNTTIDNLKYFKFIEKFSEQYFFFLLLCILWNFYFYVCRKLTLNSLNIRNYSKTNEKNSKIKLKEIIRQEINPLFIVKNKTHLKVVNALLKYIENSL